ncbi:hypothetical protein B0H10DRAFT_1835462, partial [Mycena sp. CBHHK59/15]
MQDNPNLQPLSRHWGRLATSSAWTWPTTRTKSLFNSPINSIVSQSPLFLYIIHVLFYVIPILIFGPCPGGTGKSQVIKALRDFFELRGQSRRLRLAAFTGVAARNIKGMTLHAALCLSQRSN